MYANSCCHFLHRSTPKRRSALFLTIPYFPFPIPGTNP